MAALFALCSIADRRSLPVLLPALLEPDEGLNRLIVQAVGEIGDPLALPYLRPLRDSADPMVQTAAIIALGRLGDHSVLGSLLDYVRDPEYLDGDYQTGTVRALRG